MVGKKNVQRRNQFQGEQDQAVFVRAEQLKETFTKVILVAWIFITCVCFS